MKLRILDTASRDLIEGYRFYEKQQAALGEYFLDSLYSDIDSCSFTPESMRCFSVNITAHFPSGSRSQSITG
jgi:hypothetical protein